MVTNVEIFFGLFNNIFWDLLTVFSFDFVHLKLNQSCPTSNMFVYQSSLFFIIETFEIGRIRKYKFDDDV